jgi:hypothetical protein
LEKGNGELIRVRIRATAGGIAVAGAIAALVLLVAGPAYAHVGGPLAEYGTATLDGVISPGEYDDGCVGPTTLAAGTLSYQLTICEQNDEQNDYWAVQINDFTNDVGDSPRIWFDNDHSGTVTASGPSCTYGQPDEDVIAWEKDLGFADGFYCIDPGGFAAGEADAKLPFDGAVTRKFDQGLGLVFEFSHPLDSGDPDDYSLAPHNTVGWCVTYDDQTNKPPLNPGFAYGEVQFPPGCFVDFSTQTLGLVRGNSTLLGDVYKQNALDEAFEKVKERLKGLVAACKRCPPDPTEKLKAKINEAIKELGKQQRGKALKTLKSFAKLTHGFIGSDQLSAGKGRLFLKEAKSAISLVKHFQQPKSVPTSPIAGGQHLNVMRVAANGLAR